MHKVLIRPLQFEDAEISYTWRNDPEVWKFTGSRPGREITLDTEQEWITKVLADSSGRRFAILADDQYVGNIQLTNITDNDAEYHIFIGNKEWWGKGISKLATYQILFFAKEILKLKEVYLSVRKQNEAAVKSYRASGFIKTEEDTEWIKMKINLDNLAKPMVSVFVMVYNHEKFLPECMEGMLMQKCNFPFVIVVGEDCSTDNSRNILLEYQAKYPGKFKLLLHEKNIGAHANQDAVFRNCDGKYVAMCEGDDYWIDPLKLHKQENFLNENLQFNIHSGKAKLLDFGSLQGVIGNDLKKTYNLRDILIRNYFITCTVFFRNKEIDYHALNNISFSDWMLYVLLLNHGEYALVSNEVLAVYRVHGGGSMQKYNKQYNNIIAHLKQFEAIRKYSTLSFNSDQKKKIFSYTKEAIKYDLKRFRFMNIYNLLCNFIKF